jgi:hypothetical protein
MLDWVTISSLATAGGTLVLAVATFASVRSAWAGQVHRQVAMVTRDRRAGHARPPRHRMIRGSEEDVSVPG